MWFHFRNIILLLLFSHFILAGTKELCGPAIKNSAHQKEIVADLINNLSDKSDECPLFKRKIKPKGTEVTLPHLPEMVQNPFILFANNNVRITTHSYAASLYFVSRKRGPPII